MHETHALPLRCDIFDPDTWDPDPSVRRARSEAAIGLRRRGRQVIIQRDPPAAVRYNTPPIREEGDIRGFSVSARRRMREQLSELRRDADGIFLTLTYHESDPTGKDVKRHLHAMVEALRRRWEHVAWSMVWRLEYQKRGVPHLHLLIWGVRFEHKEWLKKTWHRITGETSDDHERVGAWVERMPRGSKLSSYVAKYMAKDGGIPDGWQGRVWGVRGRKHLPVAPVDYVMSIPWSKALALQEHVMREWGSDLVDVITPYCMRIWVEDPGGWLRDHAHLL